MSDKIRTLEEYQKLLKNLAIGFFILSIGVAIISTFFNSIELIWKILMFSAFLTFMYYAISKNIQSKHEIVIVVRK